MNSNEIIDHLLSENQLLMIHFGCRLCQKQLELQERHDLKEKNQKQLLLMERTLGNKEREVQKLRQEVRLHSV
jgi:hypothetical protein